MAFYNLIVNTPFWRLGHTVHLSTWFSISKMVVSPRSIFAAHGTSFLVVVIHLLLVLFSRGQANRQTGKQAEAESGQTSRYADFSKFSMYVDRTYIFLDKHTQAHTSTADRHPARQTKGEGPSQWLSIIICRLIVVD